MVCKNTIKQNKMVKMLFFNYDKNVQKNDIHCLCVIIFLYMFFLYIRSVLVVTKYAFLNDFLLMC